MLIGYARVLKSEVQGTVAQIDALKAAGCEKIFEEAPSGGRWDRPELKHLLDALCHEDVVVVSALDRLAGSLTDLMRILEKIDKRGAYFRSLSEAIDTSGVSGRMMMRMLRSMTDFEHSQVRARTDEGQRAARARGNAGGPPPKLSPSQQREIIVMLNAGRSAADLARLFRVHRATISRLAAKAQRLDLTAPADVR